ncbi:NAD(FAD)-dependent dehydrogenase [Rhodanobacter thiooxydans]|uniref:NAD(FAD)-dependent dehydrogenase n=1 Tax=Rhodanobacter thiooxydans TaxID=416169 RepID=A0A154QFV6_9GAMM|nr:NADPH-dependent FMN reductase [Rhodanobacter thiooxydans]EIM03040.1 putative NAD(P)H-dependent FMN reductase [Rhodanobacter thiooxydans LCS2]KZC22817.1 NAD(FAD)-dependent dehydrogenase [Rhodanobacter thiooxydans]MCW0200651.1 NAD(P)H-dependent oxidoreductase [Rhodanobacter thiooxydans]
MTTFHPTPARRVLCLAGSLRRDSWNRRLLQAAVAQAPATLQLDVYDALSTVPLFDEDLEQREAAGPAGVQALHAAVAAADGLVIATPEYNHAMPGVLKNALDWLSRESPAGDVLAEKPVAVLGASSGPWGTRLAQASLRQVLHTCGALVMPAPTLFVANAASRLDADSTLADLATVQSLQDFLLAFERWIARVAPPLARPEPVATARC